MKKVDCALLFMLQEERDLFLRNNNEFIIKKCEDTDFLEFIFFDKDLVLREGVMISSGTNMGNSEAAKLMYKLSRNYKASIYINLGVAALVSELNIGDVLIASRISTLGENNASDKKPQTKDLTMPTAYVDFSFNKLNLCSDKLKNESTQEVSILKNKFQNKGIDLSEYDGMKNFKHNKIVKGRCLTVNEVVKNKEEFLKESEVRKVNVLDMEAYYIGDWYYFIKSTEDLIIDANSHFLCFKSVSDYGDNNKNVMEECGSREIAMKNLYRVVSEFCVNIYDYEREEERTIIDFLSQEISEISLDPFVDKDCSIDVNSFQNLFEYLIYIDNDSSFEKNKCIESAYDLIINKDYALFLFGRSGTGKSTFMSYLYLYAKKKNNRAILVDFSKFNSLIGISEAIIVNLIGKILEYDTELLLLFDGLDEGTSSYRLLVKALNNVSKNISKISFCVGNTKEENNGQLYDIIKMKKNIIDISFSGVSVFAPEYVKFVEKSVKFLRLEFNKNDYKDFIADSKIENVDFRLLSMYAKDHNSQEKRVNLHTFVNEVINKKYSNYLDLVEYYPPFEFEKKEFETDSFFYNILRNSYFYGYAIASKIIQIFTENDEEKIKKFIKQEYILSDDMNLMFEHILRNKRNRNMTIRNIVSALEKYEPSISVETQLLYSIVRVSDKIDNPYYDDIKNLFGRMLKKAKDNISNLQDNKKKNIWLIQYRTLCIINGKYLGCDNSLLYDYNKRILELDSWYAKINMNFHLFYYSKRHFSFTEILELSINEIDVEMFNNTYYKLVHSIISSDVEKNKALLLMNVITLLYLTNNIVMKTDNMKILNSANCLEEKWREICNTIKSQFQNEDIEFYKDLLKKIESINWDEINKKYEPLRCCSNESPVLL